MKDFKHWGAKVRRFPKQNYHAIWDGNSLKTYRIGDNVDKLEPGTQEFYDVSLGNICNLECPFCYVSAKKNGRFYDNIVLKASRFFGSMDENTKPFQIAIGK